MEILIYSLLGLCCLVSIFLFILPMLNNINSIPKNEEETFYNFKISIERLSKVMFHRFEHKDMELGIETFEDIAQFYPKFAGKPEKYQEYLKYKLECIKSHKDIDEYHRPRIIEIYNKYVTS